MAGIAQNGIRLRGKEQMIVKFLRRKDYKQVIRCKKDLRSVNISNLDMPEGTKVFILESLCPYYKCLWVISKNCGTGSGCIPFLLLIVSFVLKKMVL